MSVPPTRTWRRNPGVLLGLVAALALATAIVLSTQGTSSVAGASGETSQLPTSTEESGQAESPTSSQSQPQSAAEPEPESEPRPGGPARRAESVLLAEAPTSVSLPSGRTVRVRSVSTRRDGTLDVPDDIREAGWWRGGSRLADPFGSTLIAGHIDSTTQGLGPFAELLQAQDGDRVEVRSRGLRQTFVVRSLELVPRKTVNTLPRIFGPSGGRRLVLVTCAPPYDKPNGGYQNLALVTAVPVSEPQEVLR